MLSNRPVIALVITAILAATLACSTLTDGLSRNPTVATAQALATEAGEVGEVMQTAQALATEVDFGDVAATAQALATEVEGAGLVETAAAAVTEVSPEDGIATAQALATNALANLGTPPPDIPMPDARIDDYFAMDNLVSYATPMALDDLVAFYRDAMPKQGWAPSTSGNVETPDLILLSFSQTDRDALISLSRDAGSDRVLVQIIIAPK